MGIKDCYGYCRLCPQSIFNIDRKKDGAREPPQGVCWMGSAHDVILKVGKFENRQRIILGMPKYIPEKLR